MSALWAEQMFFTRVEADYSPRRENGFQTVWQSGGLSPESVRAIERRVACFDTLQGARRRQFFSLPGGAVVLAQSVPVTAAPALVGRRPDGIFCAHCLVLSREALAECEDDPFAIFDVDPFRSDLEGLVAELGSASGIAPRLEIALGSERRTRPQLGRGRWSASEVSRLLDLGCAAARLCADGREVVMRGGPEEVEAALRLVFGLLPRECRLSCSFNSHGDGCPRQRGAYWAIGTATEPPAAGEIVVDAGAGQVILPPALAVFRPLPREEGGLYRVWLRRALAASDPLEKVVAHAAGVAAISDALAGKECEAANGGDREAPAELVAHCAAEVGAALLAAGAVRELAEPRARRLGEVGVAWLAPRSSLTGKARKRLQRIARAGKCWLLLFWASALVRTVDSVGRTEALGQISGGDFATALAKLKRPISPACFVSLGHLESLLQDRRLRPLEEEELLMLVEAILRAGGGGSLGALAGDLADLGERGLGRLHKRIARYRGVADGFRQALAARLAASAAPAGAGAAWRRGRR